MRYLSKNRHGRWRFRIVVPAHLRAAFPELPADTSIALPAVDRPITLASRAMCGAEHRTV